jgi:hypothetical protein
MSWFIKETPLVKKYKQYRKAGTALHSQIMKSCLDEHVIPEATRLLGLRKGRIIVLDDEDDLASVMDFALHDYRWEGKSAVQRYRAEVGGKTAVEQELLAALEAATTSLFRIDSIRKADRMLFLTDLLAAEPGDPIPLIDVGFSETAVPRTLVFTRLVRLADFNMSAGASFVFPRDKEAYLLSQHKVLLRKVKSEDTAVQRYVAFFKLNQKVGLGLGYK